MTRPRTARPPMSALAMLQQEVNELFQQLSILDRSDRLPGSEWSPAVDVLELRDRLVVIVEVPGSRARDAEGRVPRAGARADGRPARAARRRRAPASTAWSARTASSSARIPLDLPVDVAAARASLRGGVLTISLPRLRERRGRETVIPIEREPTE